MKDKRNRWESCLHMFLPAELRVKATCPHAYLEDGKLYVKKEDCKDCTEWKAWESVSEKTISKITMRDCQKCQYGGRNCGAGTTTCDYIGDMEKRRPCKPGDCRAAGVFKPRKSIRRKQIRSKRKGVK